MLRFSCFPVAKVSELKRRLKQINRLEKEILVS